MRELRPRETLTKDHPATADLGSKPHPPNSPKCAFCPSPEPTFEQHRGSLCPPIFQTPGKKANTRPAGRELPTSGMWAGGLQSKTGTHALASRHQRALWVQEGGRLTDSSLEGSGSPGRKTLKMHKEAHWKLHAVASFFVISNSFSIWGGSPVHSADRVSMD